ncbi:MAG: hypothetical protein HOV81_31160 [Kofleriaceae bacterium]|nr:hypothetical protein [Kofleriaceae bacterium]
MNDTTLAAARATYYEVNGFGADGGDSLEWVPLKLWKLTVKIPNTDGRRKAVRIHDLHHVLTGYDTTLAGEAEIGAWELASGCLRWPAATFLNLTILAIGLVIAPVRLARAWARGRQTRNLYGENGVEHLLPRTVAATRVNLGLDRQARVRVRDLVGMLVVAVPVLVLMTAVALAPFAGIAALIHAFL